MKNEGQIIAPELPNTGQKSQNTARLEKNTAETAIPVISGIITTEVQETIEIIFRGPTGMGGPKSPIILGNPEQNHRSSTKSDYR